jgi:hypothetical protein
MAEKQGATTFIESTKEILDKQKKYKILIPSTEADKSAIQVAINGYAYNIPRDKVVELPESVIDILNNAAYTTYDVKKREEGEGEVMVYEAFR